MTFSQIEIPLKSPKNDGLLTLNKYRGLTYNEQKLIDMEKFYKILNEMVVKGELNKSNLMTNRTMLVLEFKPLSRNSDLDNASFILKPILDTLESTYVTLNGETIIGVSFENAHKGFKGSLVGTEFLKNDNVKNIPECYSVYTGNSKKGYPYVNLFYTNDEDEYLRLIRQAHKVSVTASEALNAEHNFYNLINKP